MKNKIYLSNLKKSKISCLMHRPVAHRGFHKGKIIPENSLLSFKSAIDKNYAIELDIRITKDKKIIVFHDENLYRLCLKDEIVSNLNYKDLDDKFLYNTKEKIPLLSEVLHLIEGKVPLLIEVKNYSKIGEFETILSKELENYKGEFAVCSFNTKVISWFKKNRPEFLRAIIFGDLKKYEKKFSFFLFLYRYIKSNPDFVSFEYEFLDSIIPTFCRYFKIKFFCWTIDSFEKMKKAKKLADNIIFENIKI